jgi:hypothetical protein
MTGSGTEDSGLRRTLPLLDMNGSSIWSLSMADGEGIALLFIMAKGVDTLTILCPMSLEEAEVTISKIAGI